MWYDTAACFNPANYGADGTGLKGNVNQQSFGPDQNGGDWYRGVVTSTTGAPVGATDEPATDAINTYPKDNDGNINWGMSIKRNDPASMNWAASRTYRD